MSNEGHTMNKHNERAELIRELRNLADLIWKSPYWPYQEMVKKAAAMLEAQPAEQGKGREAECLLRVFMDRADMGQSLAPNPSYKVAIASANKIAEALPVGEYALYTTPPAKPAREWVEVVRSVLEECDVPKAYQHAIIDKLREKNAGLPAAVPDGYVLVPVEPTHGMLIAAKAYGHLPNIWAAMLAAAPKPQDDLPAILKKQAS